MGRAAAGAEIDGGELAVGGELVEVVAAGAVIGVEIQTAGELDEAADEVRVEGVAGGVGHLRHHAGGVELEELGSLVGGGRSEIGAAGEIDEAAEPAGELQRFVGIGAVEGDGGDSGGPPPVSSLISVS